MIMIIMIIIIIIITQTTTHTMQRTLPRKSWPAQAQLMRDEFSKHRCPGQEWRQLSEAAKRTVSRSFLCLMILVHGISDMMWTVF